MIEGPYQGNRWQERFLKVEGLLLALNFIALVVAAAVFGYSWFIAGQYLKVFSIFGTGAVLLTLALVTRAPLFLLALAVPLVMAWAWP